MHCTKTVLTSSSLSGSYSHIRSISKEIMAKDGFPLAATWFPSSATISKTTETKSVMSSTNTNTKNNAANSVVIVNSATGVPQEYYRHFAHALTLEGYNVITYDYRGIGKSRPTNASTANTNNKYLSLRGFPAQMRDWALLDMAGVVEWAIQEDLSKNIKKDNNHNYDNVEFPTTMQGDNKFFLVGHSVGGQVSGLLDPSLSSRIDGMVTVSSQSGYWKYQGGFQKYSVALHTHFTMPFLAATVGYMPWSWITKGAQDLPYGVAMEWSHWCQQPGYLLDDTTLPLERFQQFKCPILAYSIDDDSWGTAKSVDAMMLKGYPNVERRHIVTSHRPFSHNKNVTDDDVTSGIPLIWSPTSLGHFGYFRESSKALWKDAFEWLQNQNNRTSAKSER